jgi:hypothetical protein
VRERTKKETEAKKGRKEERNKHERMSFQCMEAAMALRMTWIARSTSRMRAIGRHKGGDENIWMTLVDKEFAGETQNEQQKKMMSLTKSWFAMMVSAICESRDCTV